MERHTLEDGDLTAGDADFNRTVKDHLPVVSAFVLGLAFMLLLVTFRSLGVPPTAIATIIRGVLLPATMTLLGRANRYLPRWHVERPTVAGELS